MIVGWLSWRNYFYFHTRAIGRPSKGLFSHDYRSNFNGAPADEGEQFSDFTRLANHREEGSLARKRQPA